MPGVRSGVLVVNLLRTGDGAGQAEATTARFMADEPSLPRRSCALRHDLSRHGHGAKIYQEVQEPHILKDMGTLKFTTPSAN